ncbi:hypothetical protein CVV67_33180 [Arthrobacter stackebrandtii]|nr:hypothetical protein CVV67_33180 [Arthrobacter stackebrandtii]
MRPFRDTRPLPQVLRRLERCERPCGSGLVSRKGRTAAPAILRRGANPGGAAHPFRDARPLPQETRHRFSL